MQTLKKLHNSKTIMSHSHFKQTNSKQGQRKNNNHTFQTTSALCSRVK